MTNRFVGSIVGIVAAFVVVVALVGWALSFMEGPIRSLQPVPTDVPPARGTAVLPIDIHAAGRTADQLTEWAAPIAEETGIPAAALRAYANAELIAAESWPECHIYWNTLAGIGYVETHHGTYSGELFSTRSIDADGYVLPAIIGPQLSGTGGFAEIRDTDGGRLDGDTEFDRAVGPMQFIPESWARFGRDANGDSVADPNQIDDAAISAANLLCSGGRDLATPEGWASAIRSYNMSDKYLTDVRDTAASYALSQPTTQ